MLILVERWSASSTCVMVRMLDLGIAGVSPREVREETKRKSGEVPGGLPRQSIETAGHLLRLWAHAVKFAAAFLTFTRLASSHHPVRVTLRTGWQRRGGMCGSHVQQRVCVQHFPPLRWGERAPSAATVVSGPGPGSWGLNLNGPPRCALRSTLRGSSPPCWLWVCWAPAGSAGDVARPLPGDTSCERHPGLVVDAFLSDVLRVAS